MDARQVEAWQWQREPDKRGLVPEMPLEEREAWVRLMGADRLTAAERATLRALNRKLRYRAERC